MLVWRAKTSLDDSLDVIAAHGIGGTVGALLTGVFADKALNGVADGLLFGNPGQLLIQGAAIGAAIVYSGAVSFALLKLIALVIPLRATVEDENGGLDISLHGEDAYPQSEGGTRVEPGNARGGYARRSQESRAGCLPGVLDDNAVGSVGLRDSPLFAEVSVFAKRGLSPFRNLTGPRSTR